MKCWASFVSPTGFIPGLTVTKAGSGTGTVTSRSTGVAGAASINCGSVCSGYFSTGVTITLDANPAPGSTFAGWGGACSGTGACSVRMTEARAVTATFYRLHALTVTNNGGGTVSSSPAGISCGATCRADLAEGSTVTLTAVADTGWRFAGWSGACAGTGACSVGMTGAKAVTATFEPQVTVTKLGGGLGTVTSSPAGINCGTLCSAYFPRGSTVTLQATPTAGSAFNGWGYPCSGTGACSFSMTGPRAVTADFMVPKTLTLTRNGAGRVTSAPAGIDCGGTCVAQFPTNSTVTLSAAADAGWQFAGWGGACSGTGTCSVSMNVAKSVTATFNPRLTVTRSGPGSSAVISTPAGINCGSTCAAQFPLNTSVSLRAVAWPGAVFAGWGGACTGTGSCTVAMSGLKTVTATFGREY